MTELETKVIMRIREDPRAMDIAIDVLTRLDKGESMEGIVASYGIKPDEIIPG